MSNVRCASPCASRGLQQGSDDLVPLRHAESRPEAPATSGLAMSVIVAARGLSVLAAIAFEPVTQSCAMVT
jgi:hypothetical protein